MKPRKFKLHFNRINMQRKSKNIWTVHLSDRCIQVEKVDVRVPIETIYRPEAQQPRAYLSGKGVVKVKGNTAIIS